MATEDQREAGIHWSVAVQEAARLVSSAPTGERTPEEVGEQIVKIAAEIWAWRGQCFPNGAVAQPAQGDPGPTPPDESYDNDPPGGFQSAAPAAPRCGSAQKDTQGCGTEMEYFSGTNANGVDYAGFRCPAEPKSHDPAEQASNKAMHPVQWQ